MAPDSFSVTANGAGRRLCCALFLIPLLTFSTGCLFRIGPDYKTAPATLSKDWMEKGDKGLKTGAADYRTWWAAFNDPVLDGLVNKAYAENLSLRAAETRVLQARAQLGVAVGKWFPQTQQAVASFEKDRLSPATPQGMSAPSLNRTQCSIGGQASWEVDFWGKFSRGIESADAALMASVADYDNTLVTLTADVASTYVSIRTIEKRLEIARSNVRVQEGSLKIAEERFAGGTTSERDVQQAKTVLASTQADIPSLETQLQQSQNLLSILLGAAPHDMAGLIGTSIARIPEPPKEVAVGIPADLLRRRPDVRSAEYKAAAQCAQIGIAKADLLPAFSLTGNFGYAASNVGPYQLSDMWHASSRAGAMGPSFQWNILNYGRIINNVRVQDARFQEAMLTYQNAVLQAQREVEDALVSFVNSQRRAACLERSVAAAKRSLDLATIQYQQGMTDFTTVLTAEQGLLEQQNNLATTQGDISQNLVTIYRALGGGWEIREGKDFVPASVQEEMKKRTYWGGLLKHEAYASETGEKKAPPVRLPDL